MSISMMVFLRVLSVYLAVSIFNTIHFIRSANMASGRKLPLTSRRLCVAVKFGFGWRRPLVHWILDWYLGMFKPMKMAELFRRGD